MDFPVGLVTQKIHAKSPGKSEKTGGGGEKRRRTGRTFPRILGKKPRVVADSMCIGDVVCVGKCRLADPASGRPGGLPADNEMRGCLCVICSLAESHSRKDANGQLIGRGRPPGGPVRKGVNEGRKRGKDVYGHFGGPARPEVGLPNSLLLRHQKLRRGYGTRNGGTSFRPFMGR